MVNQLSLDLDLPHPLEGSVVSGRCGVCQQSHTAPRGNGSVWVHPSELDPLLKCCGEYVWWTVRPGQWDGKRWVQSRRSA